MKLVVQLPALNEAATITQVLADIPEHIPGITEIVKLVVDDGSTDNTAELAKASGAIVISHERTRGVGAAFKSGIERVRELDADIVVTIDSDGQFDPNDIATVIQPIVDGHADFTTASRFKDAELIPDMPKSKLWGNNFIARWVSGLIGKKFHDVSCGFRAYGRDAYLRLVLMGEFTYTHETFLCLAFARLRMQEVPVRVQGVRSHGESRVANNLFKYGWRTANIIWRAYRDYKPLRFFGFLALCSAGLGICFGLFLLYWKFKTGGFFPHRWAGFTCGFFLFVGLTLFIVGVLAEMLDRIRFINEEALYRVRRMEQEQKRGK